MFLILAKDDVLQIAIYCGLFLALLIVAFVILYYIRRNLDPRNKDSGVSQGLSLEQLDEMYAAGNISSEEFKTLRRALLGIPADNHSEEKSQDTGEKKVEFPDNNSAILDDSDETQDDNNK